MSKAELEMIEEEDDLVLSKGRKKEEYMVAVCCVFNFFADTLEILTPGIITQSVSCELALNKTQKIILTVALYVSLLVSSLIANLVSKPSTTAYSYAIIFLYGSCCNCFVCLCP